MYGIITSKMRADSSAVWEMYQARDYHTMTGYVYMNLSCSVELTTLNKKSLWLQSQKLSDLVFSDGYSRHVPP